jgi:PAS domain S-box-containing protein
MDAKPDNVKPKRQILHLEDQPLDVTLVQEALEQEGLDCRIQAVATRDEFVKALEATHFDVILSDFALPSFDGLAALEIATQRTPDTPFILVSGAIGEEAAIESLRNGATDYVLKHRLARLGPAVKRALEEADQRRTRRLAEEALAREQHFLRAMLESIQTGVIACDADGVLTVFNRAAREIHGVPADARLADLPGKHFQLYRANGTTPIGRQDQPLQRILRGEGVEDPEMVVLARKQTPRPVLVAGGAVIDEQGRRIGAVLALHDLSAERRLADQLRQSQKMEAVGRLAGGVAHDFNNLLTAIIGYGQLIRSRLDPGAPALRDAEEILRAAERAAVLTRQLLAFSRQQVLQPRALDLNTIVTDMGGLLKRLIRDDVDMQSAPAAGLGRVMADPGQIEQVLMNLVVNARDAMPKGGKLTIETANVELDQAYAASRMDVKPGPYVLLAVTDTGTGMSPEIAARVFEPFFTTKEVGKGTGLGLSTVHGIVKQSGGHIEVYTEPGQGTTFKIYLPREKGAVAVAESRPRETRGDRGGETILLVENEEMVRRVMVESLRLRGYTVIEAENGAAAITICERASQPLDLLITDVVMPLMSGPELVQRLSTLRPELPVLFISGFADRALIHQGLRGAGTAFLQKPFSPDVLARSVREMLDDPRQRAA